MNRLERVHGRDHRHATANVPSRRIRHHAHGQRRLRRTTADPREFRGEDHRPNGRVGAPCSLAPTGEHPARLGRVFVPLGEQRAIRPTDPSWFLSARPTDGRLNEPAADRTPEARYHSDAPTNPPESRIRFRRPVAEFGDTPSTQCAVAPGRLRWPPYSSAASAQRPASFPGESVLPVCLSPSQVFRLLSDETTQLPPSQSARHQADPIARRSAARSLQPAPRTRTTMPRRLRGMVPGSVENDSWSRHPETTSRAMSGRGCRRPARSLA